MAAQKLSWELIDEISEYIRAGNFVRTACALAGISQPVFYRWMKKGREGVAPIYVKFVQSIEQAEAECENDCVKTWKTAMPTDWRAVDKFLSKRFSGRWGDQSNVNLNHQLGGDPTAMQLEEKYDLSKMSVEELKMLEKITDKITVEEPDPTGVGE